jgi:phasin family protein
MSQHPLNDHKAPGTGTSSLAGSFTSFLWPIKFMEDKMAHTQQAMKEPRKIAEQGTQAARAAASVSTEATHAWVEALQRQAENLQAAWNSSAQMVGRLSEKTIEHFGRAFGVGGERAEQATEQSTQNAQLIMQSSTIIADSMQSLSRELLELTQKQMEQNLHRMDAVISARSPQEWLAAQSELLRNNLESFMQSTRRISEISIQMADDASKRMNDASLAPR